MWNQSKYEQSKGDFFDGIALWAVHTLDYLKSLDVPALEVSKTIVLFLASNPSELSYLKMDKELREIREELERAGYRDRFQLHNRGAVRPKDMVRALLDLTPTYVHFSGHGVQSGAICLEGNGGESIEVAPSALKSLFRASGTFVHCVLLNACYAENQAQAIMSCVPHVIGMKTAISDEAAIAFSRGFYRAIGAGRSVPESFEFGLVEMQLDSIPESLTPVLLSHESQT